jgi:prepilin-type processing-associated H-X9-DG protein/prepilin-type N-terminal cleavage/methylation domain-containing protein
MTTSFRNLSNSRPTITPASRLFPAARAFTLIELLVVISIVAVLAGLLIPAVTKAGIIGKQAKSISRLRDIQRANIQFAGEHNQFYVGAWIYKAETPQSPQVNEAWFTYSEFLNYFDNITKGHNWYWGNSPENVYSGLLPLETSKAMGCSFGINVNNQGWLPPARQMLRDVPHPANMMAFCESQDWIVTEYGSHGQYKNPEAYSGSTVAYRYNNKANVAFFDGHVETLDQKDIVNNKLLWDGVSPE